jgi:predicted flap endonuclease-1-like 5' DNA nuclease
MAAKKKAARKKAAPKRAALKKRATKKPAARKPAARKAAARKTAAKKPAAKRPATPRQDWVVTASADRPMAEIAKELSAAGFAIEQSLDQMGVFTGKSDDNAARKVRAIRGVTNVSPIPSAHVGPPDSDETW